MTEDGFLTYEEVDTRKSHECGAGDGEKEAGRVHQGDRGVAVQEHEQYERPEVGAGHVGLRPEQYEDEDAERGGEAVHGEVPQEDGCPVDGWRDSRHKVEVPDVADPLLNVVHHEACRDKTHGEDDTNGVQQTLPDLPPDK